MLAVGVKVGLPFFFSFECYKFSKWKGTGLEKVDFPLNLAQIIQDIYEKNNRAPWQAKEQ